MGQHGRGVRWWAAGAIFGLAGAVILPLVAELIAHQTLPTRSTISILPLLILGCVCLFQAVKRSTPEPYGCSPRQLPNTTKKRCGTNTVLPALLVVFFVNVRGAAQVPSGRFHVLDTYHTFNVTDNLTLALEGDYVVGRVFRDSPPATGLTNHSSSLNSLAFSRKNKTQRPLGWSGCWEERRVHGN